MTIQEFNGLFKLLLAYYPNTKNSKELANVYFLGLAELTAGEFQQAIGRVIKEYEGEFIPKVPTILKYARKQTEKVSIDVQIELAKKLLNFAISRHGRYRSVDFEDKGINAVIDSAGGWSAVCDMSMDKYNTFLSFEFPKIYKAYMETGFETSDVFVGIHDFENGTDNRQLVSYRDINIRVEAFNLPKIEFQVETKKLAKLEGMENLKKKMLVGG